MNRFLRLFTNNVITLHPESQKFLEAARPERAEALYIARYFKAFALTGRQVCVHNYPGRCPGLGASALSGRVEPTCKKFRQIKD